MGAGGGRAELVAESKKLEGKIILLQFLFFFFFLLENEGKKPHQCEFKEGLLYKTCSVNFQGYYTILWTYFHNLC